MAVKTFSTGEVLTASDTNTYLNNGGLVYITQYALSSTSNPVSNCFTSTYDNYYIQIDYTAASAGTSQLQLRLRASGTDAATNYYSGINYVTWSGTGGAFGQNPGTYLYVANKGSSVKLGVGMEIHGPKLAEYTSFTWWSTAQDNAGWNGRAIHATSAAYDGFDIISDSGNITGTCYIFGYRKA